MSPNVIRPNPTYEIPWVRKGNRIVINLYCNGGILRGLCNCVGSCPSGAIRAKHFTTVQLHQEMKEAIS